MHHKLNCIICNRQYTAFRSDGMYCSDTCRNKAWRKNHIITYSCNCWYCGEKFTTRRSDACYCSSSCRSLNWREHKKIALNEKCKLQSLPLSAPLKYEPVKPSPIPKINDQKFFEELSKQRTMSVTVQSNMSISEMAHYLENFLAKGGKLPV
jgi:hypothetical protein